MIRDGLEFLMLLNDILIKFTERYEVQVLFGCLTHVTVFDALLVIMLC